jgi:tol-pal system protein YbgF
MSAARRLFAPGVVAVAALASAGCVLPDQIRSLERDVADVRAELEKIRVEQAAAERRLAGIEARAASGDPVRREEFAAVRADMEEVRRTLTALDDRIDRTDRRMDRLSLDIQTNREMAKRPAPVPVPVPEGSDAGVPPAVGTATPNPEALYNTAYADFSKGNYELAVAGFQEYARRFPDADLADNALYWIGECRFSQGSYRVAVDAFDAMLERYPASDKAAAADLKKALAFLEMNQVGQAIVQFEHVLSKYPGSDEARVARDRLASLGATPGRS